MGNDENKAIGLEKIDVSAVNWFKDKNHYSEKSLKTLHDEELRAHPENKKKLKKLLKSKTKKLKKANKIIYSFRQLRSTYKLIQLALESFENCNENSNQTEGLLAEEKPKLSEVENIVQREKIANQNYLNDSDLPDFDKEKKNLISASEKIFKKYGFKFFEYMPKDLPWYRNAIFSLRTPPTGNVRKSKSKNDENTNEMSKWMEKLSTEKKLIDLMIPSSHDAGSYSMSPKSKGDLVGRLAQTQKLNTMGQLRSGVRGFDWRMKKQGKILVFYHGIIKGTNVMEGVKHVCKFLDTNTNEVVFIRLRSSDNSSRDMFFKNNYAIKNLLPRIFAPTEEMLKNFKEISLQDLYDNKLEKNSKGCVVLLADKPKDIYIQGDKFYCLPNTLFNQKYNKETRTSGNNETMMETEIESIKEMLKKGGFTGINTLNTANWKSIIKQILKLKSKKASGTSAYPLKDAKLNLADNIEKLITALKENGGKLPNSIGLDGAGSKDVARAIELIIDQNK